MENNGALREQVMINQFVLAAGCNRDQAAALLSQTNWQFQTALSVYFQEAAIPKNGPGFSLITPANTPATPPNFPDALTMFSNMSTSDFKMATSPNKAGASFSPRNHHQYRNTFSPIPPPPQFENSPHQQSQTNTQHQFMQNNVLRGQQASNCDQLTTTPAQQQQQVQNGDLSSEGNFLTMEMEGVPQ